MGRASHRRRIGLLGEGSMVGFTRETEEGARILIVDDDGFECRKLAKDLLNAGCDILVRSRLHDIRTAHFLADIAAVNPMVGGTSWYHFLHAVHPMIRQVRWVVITDSPSSSLAVEAMKLGAHDVLPKPVTAAELLGACWGSDAVPRPTNRLDLSLSRLEWEHINKVIRLCNGNITDAARQLGIPRQTLYNKLRKGHTSFHE